MILTFFLWSPRLALSPSFCLQDAKIMTPPRVLKHTSAQSRCTMCPSVLYYTVNVLNERRRLIREDFQPALFPSHLALPPPLSPPPPLPGASPHRPHSGGPNPFGSKESTLLQLRCRRGGVCTGGKISLQPLQPFSDCAMQVASVKVPRVTGEGGEWGWRGV